MMFMIGLELIGLKAQPRALDTNMAGRPKVKGDCVVMFPTNGLIWSLYTNACFGKE